MRELETLEEKQRRELEALKQRLQDTLRQIEEEKVNNEQMSSKIMESHLMIGYLITTQEWRIEFFEAFFTSIRQLATTVIHCEMLVGAYVSSLQGALA